MPVLRRLHGVFYWVIENPRELSEFVNVNLRREWESDDKSEGKDPDKDLWLRSLDARKWKLNAIDINGIKLNEETMNYVDSTTGYDFSKRLLERTEALRREIEAFGRVIPPVVLRAEDKQLMDGYCRYSALKDMGVKSVLAYVGHLNPTVGRSSTPKTRRSTF